MVSFTCGTCNEVMKKNQIRKHTARCRTRHVACLDCNVDFDINAYEEHRKCITEEEKYQGSNYQPKVNKGEIKQAGWAALVGKAKQNAKDPRVKKLLNQIEGFDNVPRKKPKFVNFVSNCAKCRDKQVAEMAFDLIKAAEIEEKSAETITVKPAVKVIEESAESVASNIPSNDSIEIYTMQRPYPQQFSFRNPIIRYILKSASGKVWKKLIMTCKFFFSKYPVYRVRVMESVDENWYADDENIDLEGSLPHLLLCDKFFSYCVLHFLDILIQKVTKIDIKKLELYSADLDWNEYKWITSSAFLNDICIYGCYIYDSDENYATIDKLLGTLSNPVCFDMGRLEEN